MQAYHASGNPQYYPQGQYPPGAYYTPFASHAPLYPGPGPQAFPGGVYPVDYQDGEDHARAAKQRYPTTPHIRPKYLNRSQSAQVPSRGKPPKSIMKRGRHDRAASIGVVDPQQLSRSRSNSNPHPQAGSRPGSRPSSRGHTDGSGPPSRSASTRPRANSSTRPQFDHAPPFVPDHLFLTLSGGNEIRLESIAYQELVEDLRENLLPMWPHGVSHEESRQHRWKAQFSGSPWTASGTDFLFARRMLCRLFAVLSNQGYTYLSTVNTSNTTSRLIFVATARDPTALFFSISVSPSEDKITIVDAPHYLLPNLETTIRSFFPRKIASCRYTEDQVYKVELKRSFGGSDVDKSLFTSYILKYFRECGFMLSGSFPLGRSRAPFAFGSKKEVWIFRGSIRAADSANGH